MRRRRLLAGLSTLSAALAGCGGRRSDHPWPTATRTATRTPDATATAISATLTYPEPPVSPAPEEALRFVRSYERVAAVNRVVRESADGTVRDPEVGEPRATLVVEGDGGYFLFGACRVGGRTERGSRFTINRHAVPHYVGHDGAHAVAPWSATVCDVRDDPYAAKDAGENAVTPGETAGAELQLFRFDGASHDVRVRVDYLGAGDPREVFSTTVEASSDAPDPAYQYTLGNVAVRRGRYRVRVSVPGASAAETRTSVPWTLTGPDDRSWHGLSVVVADDGRPLVGLPDTDEELLVPGPTSCFRHDVAHGES